MPLLAIESSCDETAAALLDDSLTVRASSIASQIALHEPYGGVVPELASRAHLEALPRVICSALEQAGMGWPDVNAMAVTVGPGLSSSLLLGVHAAQGLARMQGIPLYPVHHLEGHLASVFLDPAVPPVEQACPCLILLVSGGHTQLILLEAWGQYHLLGQSMDDAAGEALDKGAKLLGLGYPGGPEIEKAAAAGDDQAIPFPRSLSASRKKKRLVKGDNTHLHFSFSGLKTSLRYHLDKNPQDASPERLAHVAASYQAAVIDSLLHPVKTALETNRVVSLACVGGVAKNQVLRNRLDALSQAHGVQLYLTPMAYCTDNAAMIGAAALLNRRFAVQPVAENFSIRPSWPLS